MKKLILTTCFAFASIFVAEVHAQQVVNLSTGSGTGGLGTADPIWTILSNPYGNPMTPRITDGRLIAGMSPPPDPDEYQPGQWTTSDCGRWISPFTVTTTGFWFGANTANNAFDGEYVYRMSFNTNHPCSVTDARVNITKAGADNEIKWIIVNGNWHSVSGINFTTLNSIPQLNVTGEIVNGTNYVDVVVDNHEDWTGLLLCGTLDITYYSGSPTITPAISSAPIFCLGDPLTFNGSTSTGTIDNHFWEIAECDSDGTYTGSVWNSWFSGSPGSITFGHFIGFIPQCGKFYRIKLAVSNGCVDWEETTRIIYIECPPEIITATPEPICEKSAVELSAGGDCDAFVWQPGPLYGSPVTVSPTTTTSYTVTGTNMLGCTATSVVTVTVIPAVLDVDLSTGVYDSNGSLIPYTSSDDTWRIRGIPGTLYTGAFNTLSPAISVAPLPLQSPAHFWVTSSDQNWITVPDGVSTGGMPVEVAATANNFSPNVSQFYYFEKEVYIPSLIGNKRIELNEWAADNCYRLYLNSQVLSGVQDNIEFLNNTMDETMFNQLHGVGSIATDQTHYVSGTNTLIVRLTNGGGPVWNGSYLGLLLNARLKGECFPDKGKSVQISAEQMQNERAEATTSIYPNPSNGNFIISCQEENIQKVVIRDLLGRVVRTIEEVNTSLVSISMEEEQNGMYFAEIFYTGHTKPVNKKIIKE